MPKSSVHAHKATGTAAAPLNDSPRPKTEKRRPTEPATAPDTVEQKEELIARHAAFIEDGLFASIMASAIRSCARQLHPNAIARHLKIFVREFGADKDPLLKLMVQQLLLLHYRVATVHFDAAEAKQPEAAKLYNGAAARLLAEFRRLTLAIQAYRGQEKGPGKKPEIAEPPNAAAPTGTNHKPGGSESANTDVPVKKAS
jgi:hypothetical protein